MCVCVCVCVCVLRLVKPGDKVNIGDEVCEVQSDKVTSLFLFLVVGSFQIFRYILNL